MSYRLLLTSFDTWLPHQKSNSSDDLLHRISQLMKEKEAVARFPSLTFLRKLPVDVALASEYTTSAINTLNPDFIICCGMARRRKKLSVESNATCEEHVMKTSVDLQNLIDGLPRIRISHNAGKFVCEGFYYSLLKYISDRKLSTHCIFFHIPILTTKNFAFILEDFVSILERISYL